jgi:hypothetical protein
MDHRGSESVMKNDRYEYNREHDSEEARAALYYCIEQLERQGKVSKTLADTFYVSMPEEVLAGFIKP